MFNFVMGALVGYIVAMVISPELRQKTFRYFNLNKDDSKEE